MLALVSVIRSFYWGGDFPSLDILIFGENTSLALLLWAHFTRNIKNHFAVIGTQKVPREILVGVTILHSITFSPQRTRKARDKGRTVPFVLDQTWHGDLTGGPGSSCPVHLILNLAYGLC